MIFLIFLIITIPIAISQMELGWGGMVSRIFGLTIMFLCACVSIYSAVTLTGFARSVFLQIAAGDLVLIVAIIAYNIYMNRRSRW